MCLSRSKATTWGPSERLPNIPGQGVGCCTTRLLLARSCGDHKKPAARRVLTVALPACCAMVVAQVVMYMEQQRLKDCSSGPCPPPPAPQNTSPDSTDWEVAYSGKCSQCAGDACSGDSKDPDIPRGMAEKWVCDGPNAMLYSVYTDVDCKNVMNSSDWWRSLQGPTANASDNLAFPIRLSTGSWLDGGIVPGSVWQGTGTGHLGVRLAGLHGCSDQVRPLPRHLLLPLAATQQCRRAVAPRE